jgi:shikimate dehydrogenase
MTSHAFVLGWPIGHSRSPAMLNPAFAARGLDATMVPLAVEPERFDAVVRGLAAAGHLGASVTIPHKQAAARVCDELVAPAGAIGAVNCLVFADGRIVGHNTDAPGFVDSLADVRFDPRGTRAVLLGAGGAARAVAAGLADAGAQVDVIARRPDACAWTRAYGWTTRELDRLFPDCDLLVDCTSAALDPAVEAPLVAALPLARLRADSLVASLVYHLRPRLLDAAAARGLATLDGRGMLVHQGARAFTLWTGVPAPLEVMNAALDASIH